MNLKKRHSRDRAHVLEPIVLPDCDSHRSSISNQPFHRGDKRTRPDFSNQNIGSEAEEKDNLGQAQLLSIQPRACCTHPNLKKGSTDNPNQKPKKTLSLQCMKVWCTMLSLTMQALSQQYKNTFKNALCRLVCKFVAVRARPIRKNNFYNFLFSSV